jgi:hypothetical protein
MVLSRLTILRQPVYSLQNAPITKKMRVLICLLLRANRRTDRRVFPHHHHPPVWRFGCWITVKQHTSQMVYC